MIDRDLTKSELIERVARFYNRYTAELEQISELLRIRLTQLSLAYTIKNKLPPEAVKVFTRVKSQSSFLNKLEAKNWPQFYYPTEIIQDLIGARVVCWFIDDCDGMKQIIQSTEHILIKEEIENYIDKPKKSGYRSIHLQGEIKYDGVNRDDGNVEISKNSICCEIQIRTKLQDAWADITHEFHYKAKRDGVSNDVYERVLASFADRLAVDEKEMINIREAYQKLADTKLQEDKREGFQTGIRIVTE
ncbi:RelA/SpoT domain-containing protein [Providencia rettgeri]|uniref:GTP pyrophosphokinase n=1 Tax=Providencia rettgeri TaxID=587 RepID=UPI001E4DFBD6|nr:RelA/SpoT domain-containing protein [Providencia rettgeri]UEK58362.1 RelA/SpoT domain-containing protein [Providencia rettgeri]